MSVVCPGTSWAPTSGRSLRGNAVPSFPTAYWAAWDADAEFIPGASLPDASAGQLYAVLVFLYFGDKVTLADISGRGLCIPSGRIEQGETPEAAAVREVWEETGAHLTQRQLLGCYRLVARGRENHVRWCPVYVAAAEHFDPVPVGSESRGVMLVDAKSLPNLYFTWDPLIEAVFAYADTTRS